METNKHSPLKEESFPALESLRGSLHIPTPPPGYKSQLEKQVMQAIALRESPKHASQNLASAIISFTWISVAAACFLLTFHFNPEALSSITIDNEYVFIEEEITQASEGEIQEWLTEANANIQDEEILNELSEYDVYAE